MVKLLLYLGVLALAVFMWARWQERSALFVPSAEIFTDPGQAGLAYEDVYFQSDGNKLHGWYVPGSSGHTILWLHGNAGNVADRVHVMAAMSGELGAAHFLFDYRGYGRSEGRPTEKGIYRDAAAAWRYLVEEQGADPSTIILYGHSLGSAVATELALDSGRDAGAVVLESPFTSAAQMARLIYHGLPIHILLSIKLDNINRVAGLEQPLLVIHGDQDTVIPFEMGRQVFEAATEPKRFLPVAGADHSDCYIVGGEDYWIAWRDLMSTADKQG
jgi:fermentation-respiration switch protein FrsA (DUF1100 family)